MKKSKQTKLTSTSMTSTSNASKGEKADKKKQKKKNDKPSQVEPIYYFFAVVALIAGVYTPSLYSTITSLSLSSSRVMSNLEQEDIQIGKSSQVSDTKDESSDFDMIDETFLECNDENLSQFLHDEAVIGMHILCFPSKKEVLKSKNNDKDVELKIYKGSVNQRSSFSQFDFTEHMTMSDLKQILDTKIAVEMYNEQTSIKQPWAIFSSDGKHLVGELENKYYDHDDDDEEKDVDTAIQLLQNHGMVILVEGGSWVWPGVRIGFQRIVEVSSDEQQNSKRNITIETLSLYPLVLSVQDFIAEHECTHIQNKADPSMQYSGVSLMDKDKGRPASDFRTSQSAFLDSKGDDIMLGLEWRTASLTRIHRTYQELTQVLRYGEEEKYSAHLDWFDRNLYKQDKDTLRLIDNGRRNRLATVFWYLSDVEEGGHTVFPRFNKAPQPYNFDDCTKGLLVKPQRGKVIVFYSLTPDGRGDPLSLHGACAVKEGIKWAANKWVWNSPMNFV